MKKVNATKMMVEIGYSKRVARSMKTRYINSTLKGVNGAETEEVSKDNAVLIASKIANGSGKYKNKAQEVAEMISGNFEEYKKIEEDLDVKPKTVNKKKLKNEIEERDLIIEKLKSELKYAKKRNDILEDKLKEAEAVEKNDSSEEDFQKEREMLNEIFEPKEDEE